MVIKRNLGINVLDSAKQRIREAFAKGKQVELSFSGGKDSIVLADIIYKMLLSGEINPAQLVVVFIDEEAMYDDVIELCKKWRIKFIEAGVEFKWYCVQVKHFSCLKFLADEESYILWDKTQKDKWVRPMPPFAITDDPFLIPYKDNYQAFGDRRRRAYNLISMRGVRVSESVQRQKNVAKTKDDTICLPIYDFTDKDIWLYIKKFDVEYPITYHHLYAVGVPTNQLRISQFFSIDSAKSLVKLAEYEPNLMERISKREPNAYLCAMYWDSEMFGRSTSNRKKIEQGEQKDYKKEAIKIMRNPDDKQVALVKKIKSQVLKCPYELNDSDWQHIYQILITGDPKGRQTRALIQKIYGKERTRK